jgi:hypothetical protein
VRLLMSERLGLIQDGVRFDHVFRHRCSPSRLLGNSQTIIDLEVLPRPFRAASGEHCDWTTRLNAGLLDDGVDRYEGVADTFV